MDYEEEQRSELEALEAIYPNEFRLISEEPISFRISIQSSNYEEGGDEGLKATIKFVFTPKYPEELPEVEVVGEKEEEDGEEEEDEVLSNLDPEYIPELKELMAKEANENLGMAMIFTIVSAAIEWLNVKWETILKERDEEAERKRVEEEEEEHKRFEGTRVTVQSFIAWKMGFDAEREAAKKKQTTGKEKVTLSTKLTGKELFMTDKTLIDSDLKFEEDEEAGPIDESLFEDIEDLEIEDSDEENE